jgi:hypothetical protein
MYGCNRLRVVIIKRLFLQTRGVHVWAGFIKPNINANLSSSA